MQVGELLVSEVHRARPGPAPRLHRCYVQPDHEASQKQPPVQGESVRSHNIGNDNLEPGRVEASREVAGVLHAQPLLCQIFGADRPSQPERVQKSRG